MVRYVEASLQGLQFQFARNGNKTVAEFEVKTPAYFRIVLRPSPISRGSMLIPQFEHSEVTAIQVKFGVDASDDERSVALRQARRFIGVLMDDLPDSSWAGLGLLGSRREKKRWVRFTRRIE